jgi:hypothetical protein
VRKNACWSRIQILEVDRKEPIEVLRFYAGTSRCAGLETHFTPLHHGLVSLKGAMIGLDIRLPEEFVNEM